MFTKIYKLENLNNFWSYDHLNNCILLGCISSPLSISLKACNFWTRVSKFGYKLIPQLWPKDTSKLSCKNSKTKRFTMHTRRWRLHASGTLRHFSCNVTRPPHSFFKGIFECYRVGEILWQHFHCHLSHKLLNTIHFEMLPTTTRTQSLWHSRHRFHYSQVWLRMNNYPPLWRSHLLDQLLLSKHGLDVTGPHHALKK